MTSKGQWITINGQHILVEEGETPMTAYIRHMGKKNTKKIEPKKVKTETNKFGIDDPYILFGEKHGTGTVTKKEMVDYYLKKGQKTGDDKMINNAEEMADAYIKYREELDKKRKKG